MLSYQKCVVWVERIAFQVMCLVGKLDLPKQNSLQLFGIF